MAWHADARADLPGQEQRRQEPARRRGPDSSDKLIKVPRQGYFFLGGHRGNFLGPVQEQSDLHAEGRFNPRFLR